jgi:mannose-6-phosphate isomerase-like protein (cupin superfamily)
LEPSVPPTASPTIRLGALSIRFVLDAEASGGCATAFECEVPANAVMSAAHSHDGFEETNYGLAGVTTFTVDGELRELHPGEVVFIPRGVVHAFENRSEGDARFLAVVTPGALGPDYFEEISAVLSAAAGGPPDPAAMGEVMRRHGLSPATESASRTPEA